MRRKGRKKIVMKVQELRRLLSASDREHLEKAFVECYKNLSKAKKEEADPTITDILEGKTVEHKKAEGIADFEELEQRITTFIDNAYAQNYLAPNRIIPKRQRPKWRFMVKGFIKDLEKIPPESGDYAKAVKLLTDLYRMICYACNYYLFSTDDAFRSIGWVQSDLFELLVKKTFAVGYTRENISQMLLYAVTGGLSRESLYVEQETVLIGALKTSDVKELAIEEAKKLVEANTEKLTGLGKYDNKRYALESAIGELCGMILLLFVALSEPDQGVAYYFQKSPGDNKEITLYCALELIGMMEEDDLWMKVYEYGLKKKIKPRDWLREKYEVLKSRS